MDVKEAISKVIEALKESNKSDSLKNVESSRTSSGNGLYLPIHHPPIC